MAKVETRWDEAKVEQLIRRIVARAFSVKQLMNHVTDYVWTTDENADADVLALRTAIDPKYQELRERYEASHFNDQEAKADLNLIEEELLYYVGLEVGRRVSRD